MKQSKIKLILSDLDGTLLSSNNLISKENLSVIHSLQKKHILFSIATGRSDNMCTSYIKDCNINIPIISNNGALIRNPITKEILYKNTINPKISLKIMDFCSKNNLDYMAYNTDKIYFTTNSTRINKFIDYNKIAKNNNITPIDLYFYNNNHLEIANEGVLKILLFSNTTKHITSVCNFIKEFPEISYVLSEKNALDISSIGTSKGTALNILSKYLNIKKSEICVFGDYTNDLSMFENAGISFAMKNSPDQVKSIATYITDSNNNFGVAKGINKILLNN